MQFDVCREQALATIGEAAAKLRDAAPVGEAEFHFNLSDLASREAAETIVDQVRSRCNAPASVIYCFELENVSGYTSLRENFSRRATICDQTGNQLCYSRLLNEDHPNALYVGSSRSFTTRFSQHLGLTGGAGTYSMRLNRWASTERLEVRTRLWIFPPGVDAWTLELLEQALWDTRRPLLGKRSGR